MSAFIKPHDALQELHVKVIAGMVGTAPALAFRQSLAVTATVTAGQILRHFETHRDKLGKLSLPELVLLNEEIFLWLHGQRCRTDEEETVRQNLLAYLTALKQLKQHEALAHLASLVENPKFIVVVRVPASFARAPASSSGKRRHGAVPR